MGERRIAIQLQPLPGWQFWGWSLGVTDIHFHTHGERCTELKSHKRASMLPHYPQKTKAPFATQILTLSSSNT